MLKQIMLMMLQILNLLMMQMLNLLMLLTMKFVGVFVIPFLQFYNPTICLDIKDFDVCDLDPSNDHVSFDTIVCHQSPYDSKDDFLHLSMILSLVLILNFLIIMLFWKYVRDPAF
jgi:hypothetical protein